MKEQIKEYLQQFDGMHTSLSVAQGIGNGDVNAVRAVLLSMAAKGEIKRAVLNPSSDKKKHRDYNLYFI